MEISVQPNLKLLYESRTIHSLLNVGRSRDYKQLPYASDTGSRTPCKLNQFIIRCKYVAIRMVRCVKQVLTKPAWHRNSIRTRLTDISNCKYCVQLQFKRVNFNITPKITQFHAVPHQDIF